jgi:hypothetical protein
MSDHLRARLELILEMPYKSNMSRVMGNVVTGEKNSPTVTRVLGAWGYNWATQFPGDINMETWSSRLGVGAQG